MPLARETYLDALTAALFTGRLARTGYTQEVARAALAAPVAFNPRPVDRLLDGLATLIADGPVAGTPRLREALEAFARRDVAPGEALRWRWLAGRAAGFIWEYEGWDKLTAHHIRAAREAGLLAELPLALTTRVGVHLRLAILRPLPCLWTRPIPSPGPRATASLLATEPWPWPPTVAARTR